MARGYGASDPAATPEPSGVVRSQWFEANPERKRGFRPVIAGECPVLVPDRFHYCIVTRIGPGVRAQTFVHFGVPVDREFSAARVAKLAV